jgi:hypothetical protein
MMPLKWAVGDRAAVRRDDTVLVGTVDSIGPDCAVLKINEWRNVFAGLDELELVPFALASTVPAPENDELDAFIASAQEDFSAPASPQGDVLTPEHPATGTATRAVAPATVADAPGDGDGGERPAPALAASSRSPAASSRCSSPNRRSRGSV